MSSLSGVSTFFISIWIIRAMTQNVPDSIGIAMTDCRITGIALFTGKNPSQPSFDFSEAQEVCKQTGLVLARKSQIENALKHGFETCSFGWVAEGFTVISRKTSNIKCGQGKTGVAQWTISHDRKSNAYCYNSSDTWINSCIPEASTTALPDAFTEMNTTSTDSSQDTSAITRTSEAKPTQRLHPLFRIICVTETILPTETIRYEEEITLPPNRAAFKNDGVIFGGIPTTLLVLALIFFVAAVVLAVCYIKKYKKTFPFSGKEEKREVIETKDMKETKPSGKTPEQEPRKNEKKAEETQAKPEPSVKCMEAEV
ncbi:lymphatic vessel endothelial hyaluronic acid receptor 1 [Eublepharis macularius]|uniref:Lymphatic vessel endothelial hyaluronic acid receptor 1 n=1 Tax=Eublepharis macularius TaxID=481883 RepID=A0AA97KRN2_EUBMA|nr:lymphatic vessel endothelial hyaluronic acid receptor 1 [Eublepharis macularius]